MIEALDIRVRGIVQGVGFRPFVYRLARRYLVSGWVLNDLDGVFIHAEAETQLLDGFVNELHMDPPAAARIREVELKEVPLQDCVGFEIRESEAADAEKGTLVSADLGICDDCMRELFDRSDRRFRYPFINCTNCGPRFTIIDELPYDRPSTSMRDFQMCDACAREYADPGDRRFHAQPDACFDCGPRVSWIVLGEGDGSIRWGATREESDAILAEAVRLLMDGAIVAVKGLGGFHLVCDAGNPAAIAELRRRKRRDGKAFAVMAADVEAARAVCEVSPAEGALLKSAARPIVLLRKRAGADVAPGLAPGLADRLPELGVMLPATPVQALLAHDFRAAGGSSMLVMTSGNVHDEPIVVDDAEAVARLGGIADAVLGNDRPILARYDDSVVRVVNLAGEEAIQFIRRARGYAPVPVAVGPAVGNHADKPVEAPASASATGQAISVGTLSERPPTAADGRSESVPTKVAVPGENPASDAAPPSPADGRSESVPAGVAVQVGNPAYGAVPSGLRLRNAAIFAAGSEQKNTFTYLREGDAFVSQHVGDMEDADVYDAWLESKARFEKLFEVRPRVLACDLHPEYLASKWARGESFRTGLALTEVQHHHAHIASVLGEHGLFGPAIGIALDGTGYGADGAIWGGEVLIANQVDYERFANFTYLPMPGGAAAVKNPARMAYGALWAFDLLDHPGAAGVLDALGEQAQVCAQMIEAGLNTPYTSSAGRLFDAMAALLGVCAEPTYEGEPAILLDAARAEGRAPDDATRERYAMAITKNSATAQSTAHDTSVVLLDAEPTVRAALDDLVAGVPVGEISLAFHEAVVGAIVQMAELARAMYDIELVALSGGCFMNRFLLEESARQLGERGFTVAVNAALPPNDGCVSFGQAVVASASR